MQKPSCQTNQNAATIKIFYKCELLFMSLNVSNFERGCVCYKFPFTDVGLNLIYCNMTIHLHNLNN